MKRAISILVALLFFSQANFDVYAEQTIIAYKVDEAPKIDGQSDDAVWQKAQAFVTHDHIADLDITLKAVYTDSEIFFLVNYPDPDASLTHKSWVWDKDEEIYTVGTDREDTFVFKWSMEQHPIDLSLSSIEAYKADIWYWKADRTNPVGYADDKLHQLSNEEMNKSKKVINKSGNTMYLVRLEDNGKPAYHVSTYVDYEKDVMLKYTNQIPQNSRADVKAKGAWSDDALSKATLGWTIEFRRNLQTGYLDDVQFETSESYQFGVSRYESAGRKPDSSLSQPFHGAGDVSESLTLRFGE